MRTKKPKHTPTGRYFSRTKPFDRKFAPAPSRLPPPGMQWISRLGFNGLFSGQQQWSCHDLARTLASYSFNDTIFFPDTCFFMSPMAPHVWDSLCSRTVALVPGVLGELQSWISNPFSNQDFAKVVQKAVGMRQVPPNPRAARVRWACRDYLTASEWQPYAFRFLSGGDCFRNFAFQYYRDLLLVRKLVGPKVAGELKRTLGREPTDEEFRVAIRKQVGRRGEQIAFKGWKDSGKRNYSTDEELVLTAALTAIVTGRETLILTWDTDLHEQFVKLMFLIASDYQAHIFGEHAASGVQSIPWKCFTLDNAEQKKLHTTSESVSWVACEAEGMEKLLPNPYHRVNCYCYLLGNNRYDLKMTRTVFSAEREMAWMLQVKARTSGRNTDRFGPRNIHGGSFIEGGRQYAAFTLLNDIYTDFMGIRIAGLDLEHALTTNDPFVKKYM